MWSDESSEISYSSLVGGLKPAPTLSLCSSTYSEFRSTDRTFSNDNSQPQPIVFRVFCFAFCFLRHILVRFVHVKNILDWTLFRPKSGEIRDLTGLEITHPETELANFSRCGSSSTGSTVQYWNHKQLPCVWQACSMHTPQSSFTEVFTSIPWAVWNRQIRAHHVTNICYICY